MAKINAQSMPTYTEARGTDETAVSADGSVHFLDPTASVQDGELKDNPDLKIEGDDAEQFETREERDQRELREREQDARERTDAVNRDAAEHAHESGDTQGRGQTSEVKSSAGTSSRESSKPLGKNAPKN